MVALPLAVAVVGLAPLAEASITSPGSNGIQYAQNTTIDVKATARAGQGTDTLALTDPHGNRRTVATTTASVTQSSTLEYFFDTGCYPDCSTGPALNGSWTVTLSGTESDTRSLVLAIPPATPQNPNASLTASREITVTWTPGTEPDLTGWSVLDAGSGADLRDLARSDCSGGTCQAVFDYTNDDQGTRSFTIVAHRACPVGCSGSTVDSAQSAAVSQTLPPPPPPSPTPAPSQSANPSPSPTAAGSAGGSAGSAGTGSAAPSPTGSSSKTGTRQGSSKTGSGSSSTGTSSSVALGASTRTASVQAARKAFALSFSTFAPSLGIAKLPPLPQAPTLAADDNSQEAGGYQTNLGYKSVVKREKVTTISRAASEVTGAVNGVLDSRQFLQSLAGALVLLLAGAHLRRWLAQSR